MTTITQKEKVTFEPWENPEAKPLISFRQVTKKFGSFTAIEPLDLDIYEREFFALLGPSGCGKTTLMRMLAGFTNPSSGTITLDGRDIVPVPANKRPVNMMFQSYALFPHLTIWDNIAFGLKRAKMGKDEIAQRVEEMLRLTRLEKFAKRKPHQISGGQKQRVALARSLARAPKLLLLDEPLGALDAKLRQQTQFELMDIQEKTGTTFVIVTHDQEEAMTVASRVAVMDLGHIAQVATPAMIYEAPNSIYVADFIGDVNIIEGRITGHKTAQDRSRQCMEVAWAEGQAPLAGLANSDLDLSDTCALALRPEKIVISKEKPDGRPNTLHGRIHDIAYLGNLSTFHVKLTATGQIIKAQSANTRRIAARELTWDDEVWLSWTDTAGIILPGART